MAEKSNYAEKARRQVEAAERELENSFVRSQSKRWLEGGNRTILAERRGRRGRKMQLHFSPSMRSITISSSSSGGNGNGGGDLMKIKVAARHISYRTLFHTILILVFLLPFVFILTAVVTLEGFNKCSSIGIL